MDAIQDANEGIKEEIACRREKESARQLTFAILDDRHANTVDRQQWDSSQVCVLSAE